MILSLSAAVRERLDRIEREEGVPPLEIAHQAVEVWSQLTAAERRTVGLAAMRLVAARART